MSRWIAGGRAASAYEVAVANGFVGTEAAWLASLVGPMGTSNPTGGAGGALSGTYPNPGLNVTAVDAVVAGAVADEGSDIRAAFASRGAVKLHWFGTVDTTGATDCTATVNAALAALYTLGGGTLEFPLGKIKITGQIVIPNDGGGIFATKAQLQPTFTLVGQGGYHSGQVQAGDGTGGTRLLMTYQGGSYNAAKLVTRGLGRLVVRDLVFQDTVANSQTPFLFTTNTTLHVVGCAFLGATGGTACQQDAIVLGGTKKRPNGDDTAGYDDPDSAFQGYGTVIERNYFNRVRRMVYGRSYTNHTVTRDNFADKQCGTNLTGGALIEFDGNLDAAAVQPGDYCTGDVILSNYLNGWPGGYAYMVKLKQAAHCVVAFNGAPDPGPNAAALVRCEAGMEAATTYPSIDNLITGNHSQGIPGGTPHLSEDAASAGRNNVIGGSIAEGTKLRGNVSIEPGDQNPTQVGKVNFTGAITSSADDHFWTVRDPRTAPAGPWNVNGGGVDWLALGNGAAPAISMAARLILAGFGTQAGSTKLDIGNNSTPSDAELVLNPPTGQNATVKWQYGGVNKWQMYNGAGDALYLRDMANGVMAMEFQPGAGVAGSAKFAGKVGFNGATPVGKAANPGTATGTDAAVINAIVTALRNLGLVT